MTVRRVLLAVAVVLAVAVAAALPLPTAAGPVAAGDRPRYVHLGQVFSERASLFPGDPRVEIRIWNTIPADGYRLERVTTGTHTGTHVSAPCHFLPGATSVPGARCLDDLPAHAFVRPAAVIDVRERVAAAPDRADFAVSWQDVQEWERRHGRIPSGAFVVLHTGFGRLFGVPARPGAYNDYFDPAPGFAADTVRRLVAERGIGGLGSDTFGPDATSDTDYTASTAIYRAGGITIENMAHLEALPPRGATIAVTPARLVDGSGFPANPLGIIPD